MTGHTFIGKQRLCYTNLEDFTDFQGIGRDPLFKRYDSVLSVVKRHIPLEYQHFLSAPEYIEEEDQIAWHIDNWNDVPQKYVELIDGEKVYYKQILDRTLKAYNEVISKLSNEDLLLIGGAVKYTEEDFIYCCDDKVFLVAWGMTYDRKKHKEVGSIIHMCDFEKKYTIVFDAGENGKLTSKIDGKLSKKEGSIITERDVPQIESNEGWVFVGWDTNPIGDKVIKNATYKAIYDKFQSEEKVEIVSEEIHEIKKYHNISFDAGKNGTIEGFTTLKKEEGSYINENEIPKVNPLKGFKFEKWDESPLNYCVNEDRRFVAIYKEDTSFFKKVWLWLSGLFTGKGYLRWLLLLLLLACIMLLLGWLFKGCKTERGTVIDKIERSDGSYIDDNGIIKPIPVDNGKLPDNNDIVAPAIGDGYKELPIIIQPGAPNIAANRLFLFLENDDDNVESLAKEFKAVYAEDKYSVIGFDKEVKSLVIQIPEEEREEIRNTINKRIPNHKFIVFDEEVYELRGHKSQEIGDLGWHISAINLENGWNYTKGNANIKVAIVDDGIDIGHPMFKGRICEAYNVFRKDDKLSVGEGHGTHTAGLAVGSSDFFNKGASGVAPNCKLIPVQVFDNGQCPLSALISGIMYSIHHDADVVNVSIGPSFKGLNVLPVKEQEVIAKNRFGNVAVLWNRVCGIAEKKNCILVFAAGNDDILSSIPPENRNASSIVVTAVDKRYYPTDFTNYGTFSDISAPGKNIYSSYPTSSFESCDGTSMSAPIVSGTIALMKTLKKDLTVQQAKNALYNSGHDVYGWIPPMVLVDKALLAVKNKDFERRERKMKSVPDSVDVHLNSGKIPSADNNEDIEYPITAPDDGKTDYDMIKKQIEEYKRKIEELERLLPQK